MNMVGILNVQSLGKGKRPPTESEGPPTPNCRPAIYIRTFLDNDP